MYPPNANGDVAPEASFTKGMYGPVTMAFDPSGDLWVANENTSDLFELTKAQLAMHNPVPNVTIFAASPGALANPFGMAFDAVGQPLGGRVTIRAGSTSTQRANWPGRARRRPTPPFRQSSPSTSDRRRL